MPIRDEVKQLSVMKLLSVVTQRDKVIAAASEDDIAGSFLTNETAKERHPGTMMVSVRNVEPLPEGYLVSLSGENGAALPYFHPGQYVNLNGKICPLIGAPVNSATGQYEIFLRGGKAPLQGEMIVISEPFGFFTYTPLRDADSVILAAKGYLAAPFLSMLAAQEGETADLMFQRGVIIIEYDNPLMPLFRKSLFGKNNVSLQTFGSDQELETLLDSMQDEKCSLFLSGVSYDGKGYRSVRENPYGVMRRERELASVKTFEITVRTGKKIVRIPCRSDETIMAALNRAGITAPQRCGVGECGFCRSFVPRGEYRVGEETEHRRYADRQFHYIHPCVTYPCSDLSVELPGGERE